MRKGISLIIALALTFVSLVNVKADELTDAQKQLNNIQNSIEDKKDELEDINKQKETVQKSLEELDKKMEESEKVLNSLNSKINDINKQISQSEKQIQESLKNLEDQNELFKKRLRAMYVNGNESYLEIILNSSSFSDFFSRLDTVVRVMEYDKKLIQSIENNKKALELQKSQLEKSKKENLALKSEADKKYSELKKSADEKEKLMASLEKDKAAYERMIEQEEQESKAIATMIASIKKKKEEEAKKQQEINRGSASSGTTTVSVNSSIGKLFSITGGKAYPITSAYGPRVHPVFGVQKPHTGIDIGVPMQTPIYSLADGEIIYSGWQTGYGNVVMVDHGNLISLYAHNSSLSVKVGQTVKGGQLIAYSGSTGYSTGPHLHFEIRMSSGATINPASYYIR
ncbi:peptidoglycan DD-metalloendopeptidase family protein [Clostridium sp. SYSU_GA19001]|uniref:murein hydrolase activator EnvC family protein n=1 Tax=Clostridium caldaquaticum TaxID=2940653 RepID=UPI0020777814|nr:peptidoglycan DD-metalloendopeptidase family protein [Clostridium caldaquaticum]MCM8710170.1 peptidoglycan DD-metalloendopeptidase family protein [Clostridium caldaquaticum]